MATISETKRITNILNNIYTNDKFLSDLANLCNNNYNAILFALGDILEYYITSRDNRILTLEEMNVVVGLFKYIGESKNYKVYNMKDNELPSDAIKRNVIKNGYMTKSINSFFLKRIKRHGLGSIKSIDDKLNKDFEYLETIFGKNNYSVVDNLENNQFCMSTPGTNSFYHAGSNSPKRFFLGILGQEEQKILPITFKETKIDYFKRVLSNKLAGITLDDKSKKKALKIGNKLIKKLCKKDPSILLIPTHSDNYLLKVTKIKNDEYNLMPFDDWIYFIINTESSLKFFSRDFGDANGELGNIISYKTIIPYKELGIIYVPDRYKIMQIIAMNKNYPKNSKINYLTGELIVNEK